MIVIQLIASEKKHKDTKIESTMNSHLKERVIVLLSPTAKINHYSYRTLDLPSKNPRSIEAYTIYL